MTIRLLSPDVSSKIAAGEVVERPASVVKELVENSLDAKSTHISVEVKNGGIEYIRVSDNGIGIPSEQVALAMHRFSTSKISAINDLESIETLGFRGEALHSIASVSSMSLITRGKDEEFGVRQDVVDGVPREMVAAGTPAGTSVTVSHLFRNFPARRKFLRSVATETARIQTLITRYALSFPSIKFRLKIDQKDVFSSSGTGDLREVVSRVYGLKVAESMLDLDTGVEFEDERGLVIEGLIGPPSVDRSNGNYVSLFVNRRWIQNRTLNYALKQSYLGFLQERRHPLAIVQITIPGKDIDVNVHPAKTEVRFRYGSKVFDYVQQVSRKTLITHSPVPEIKSERYSTLFTDKPHKPSMWARESGEPLDSNKSIHLGGDDSLIGFPSSNFGDSATPKSTLPVLRVIGQIRATYIVAEGPQGMYLIDQHAAHERVVFEKVSSHSGSQFSQVQSLLEPINLEISLGHQEILESQKDIIARLGFEVEAFGVRSVLLRGVPSLLNEGDPGDALIGVLDLMSEGGGFESWEERAAYSIACHGSIRAGKTLAYEEMIELIRQLEACYQPNTCPHGRPTMIQLSLSQLEREFGRR